MVLGAQLSLIGLQVLYISFLPKFLIPKNLEKMWRNGPHTTSWKKKFFRFFSTKERKKTYEVLNIPTQQGDMPQLWGHDIRFIWTVFGCFFSHFTDLQLIAKRLGLSQTSLGWLKRLSTIQPMRWLKRLSTIQPMRSDFRLPRARARGIFRCGVLLSKKQRIFGHFFLPCSTASHETQPMYD